MHAQEGAGAQDYSNTDMDENDHRGNKVQNKGVSLLLVDRTDSNGSYQTENSCQQHSHNCE